MSINQLSKGTFGEDAPGSMKVMDEDLADAQASPI